MSLIVHLSVEQPDDPLRWTTDFEPRRCTHTARRQPKHGPALDLADAFAALPTLDVVLPSFEEMIDVGVLGTQLREWLADLEAKGVEDLTQTPRRQATVMGRRRQPTLARRSRPRPAQSRAGPRATCQTP